MDKTKLWFILGLCLVLVLSLGILVGKDIIGKALYVAVSPLPIQLSSGVVSSGQTSTSGSTSTNSCLDANNQPIDLDVDGITDCVDNCPGLSNPLQSDADNDAIGDACDQSGCMADVDCPAGEVCVSGACRSPLNTLPYAWDNRAEIVRDITGYAYLYATDADGDILTFSIGTAPQHGTFAAAFLVVTAT